MNTKLIISSILLFISVISSAQCKNLSFDNGVEKQLISSDLFNIFMNSEWMGCPKYLSGDESLCGTIQNKKNEWDIGIPDRVLFSMFFEPSHYAYCKEIFNNPIFVQSLASVPEPSEAALAWFAQRNTYHTVFFSSEEKYPDTLDKIQKKVLTVMHQVKSWTFCPESHNIGPYSVHGLFDKSKNIVIFNTACKAGKIYDADIKTLSLAFRLHFVCAHEFAHAIDQEAGQLSRNSSFEIQDAENRANVNGLVMTMAFSKLVNRMLEEYFKATKMSSTKLRCDTYYLKQAIKEWKKVNDYLITQLKLSKKIYDANSSPTEFSMINNEWNIWGCLEIK